MPTNPPAPLPEGLQPPWSCREPSLPVGRFVWVGNDRIQPRDPSARNSLFCNSRILPACGLRRRAPSRPGEKNPQERAEPGPDRPRRPTPEVRNNPPEPLPARAFPQRKRLTESGWPSVNGGGGGNQTCVLSLETLRWAASGKLGCKVTGGDMPKSPMI